MRDAAQAAGWVFLAVAFMALGADAYWSWRAQGFMHQPITFYLHLLDPAWGPGLQDWADERSARSGRVMRTLLAWPVWGPAFVIGSILTFAAQSRARR